MSKIKDKLAAIEVDALQVILDAMRDEVLKATPVNVEPKIVVADVKKSDKALAFEALLNDGSFDGSAVSFGKVVSLLLGEPIEIGKDEKELKHFGPDVEVAKCNKFSAVVPIKNIHSHDYVCGNVYLTTGKGNDEMFSRRGRSGNHMDPEKNHLRYATREEIDAFFKEVKDKGYIKDLAQKF